MHGTRKQKMDFTYANIKLNCIQSAYQKYTNCIFGLSIFLLNIIIFNFAHHAEFNSLRILDVK